MIMFDRAGIAPALPWRVAAHWWKPTPDDPIAAEIDRLQAEATVHSLVPEGKLPPPSWRRDARLDQLSPFSGTQGSSANDRQPMERA